MSDSASADGPALRMLLLEEDEAARTGFADMLAAAPSRIEAFECGSLTELQPLIELNDFDAVIFCPPKDADVEATVAKTDALLQILRDTTELHAQGIAVPVIVITPASADVGAQLIERGADDAIPRAEVTAETLGRAAAHAAARSKRSRDAARDRDALRRELGLRTAELGVQVEACRRVSQILHLRDRAIQAAPSGVLISDASQPGIPVIFASDAVERITGYRPAEFIGKNPRFLHGDDTDQPAIQVIRDSVAEGREFDVVLRNYRKDGSMFWNEMMVAPVADEDGNVTHYIAIIQDATARIEQQHELERAKQAAEDANRAKSAFLANMSHEIRTPLNGVIGMTELLADTDLHDDQRGYVDTINTSARHLSEVINDILDFSKIESGHMALESVDFNLERAMSEVLKPLAIRAFRKDIELSLELDPTVPRWIRGDRVRLMQIVVNLVSNAVKFTTEGEILVSVSGRSERDGVVHLAFTVSDTGPGIPRERQEAIFRPFEQVDTSTTRRYGGTGLGLSICASLVMAMNGEISLDSQPGNGASFHFTVQVEPAHQQSSPSPEKVAWLRGLEVLVVDDREVERRILRDALSTWGMKPTVAASGTEAIALLSARENHDRFAVVISDVRMPGVDGYELAQWIRVQPSLAGLPIILVGVQPGMGLAPAQRLGVSAMLGKPFVHSQLLDELMNLVLGDFAAAERQPNPTVAVELPPLRILVAEDNAVSQRVALSLLEKHGHSVEVVGNGRLALDATKREEFDVVLMDGQMPEMDGIEATRAIRARETVAGGHLPIVAVTAHAMAGDREQFLASGMDEYVAKPLRAQKVLEAIRNVLPAQTLQRRPPARPPKEPTVDMRREANPTLVQEIVELFAEHTRETLDALEQGKQQRDTAALARAAHALKGSAGALTVVMEGELLDTAIETAHAVENDARKGRLDEALGRLPALEEALRQLNESMGQVRSV